MQTELLSGETADRLLKGLGFQGPLERKGPQDDLHQFRRSHPEAQLWHFLEASTAPM